MTTATTSKRKPSDRSPSPGPRYILVATIQGTTNVMPSEERPTMDFVKTSCGEGVHTLYNGEGKVLKHFHVTTNRNGNLKIVGETPHGLEAISTLNLDRLVKQYLRIVRIWPAKVNDAKALQKELARRVSLMEDAIEADGNGNTSLTDMESDEVADALAQAVEESRIAREQVAS